MDCLDATLTVPLPPRSMPTCPLRERVSPREQEKKRSLVGILSLRILPPCSLSQRGHVKTESNLCSAFLEADCVIG